MINNQKDQQRSIETLKKQINRDQQRPISPKNIRNKEKFPSVHFRSSSSQGYNFDGVTRDISHRFDQSMKVKSRFESHEMKLQEILGIKHEHYKLPSTLAELQAFVNKSSGEETKEKLLQDLENMKLSIGSQKEKFLGKIIKEGGLLYRTQSGLLQPQVIKIYDQILKRTRGSSIELPRSDLELGAPSGRKEVEILITWLEFMIQTHIDEEKDLTLEEKVRRAQLIYTACYKEVIRQISVNCVERGVLLQRIWNASIDLQCLREDTRVKQIEELKGKVNTIIENSLAEIKEKLEISEKKCRDLRDIIKDKDIKIDNLKRLVDDAKQLADKDKLVYVDIGFHRNMTKRTSKITRKKTLKAIEEVPSQDSAYIKQSNLGKIYPKRQLIMFGYFDTQDVFHKQKIIQKNDSGISVTQYFDEVTSLAECKNAEIMTENEQIPEIIQENIENIENPNGKTFTLFAHKSFQYPERRPMIKIYRIVSMNISIKPRILVKSITFQQEDFFKQVSDDNQETIAKINDSKIKNKKIRTLSADDKEKNIEDIPISGSESEESEEIIEKNNAELIQDKNRRSSVKVMKGVGKNKKNSVIKTSSTKKYMKKTKEHSQEPIKNTSKIQVNKDEIGKADTLKVSNVEYDNFANVSIGDIQKKGKKSGKTNPVKGQSNVESAREKGREYYKEKQSGKDDKNSPESDAKDRVRQKDEKPKEKIEKPKVSEEKFKKKDEKSKPTLEKPKILEDKLHISEDHPKTQEDKNPEEKHKPNEKTQSKLNQEKLSTQEKSRISPKPKPTDQKNIVYSSTGKKQNLNTSFNSISELSDPPSPKYTQILSVGISKSNPNNKNLHNQKPHQENLNPKTFSPNSFDKHTKSCQTSINPIPYEDLSRAQLLSSIQQLKNILQDISNNEEKKTDLMKDSRSRKRGIKLDKVLNKLFTINEGGDILDDEIVKISISCQTDESEDLIVKNHDADDENHWGSIAQSDKKHLGGEEKIEKSTSQTRQRKVSEDFSDGENMANSASKGKRWSQHHKTLTKKPLSKFEEFILGQTTRRTIITHPGQKMLGLVVQSIDNIYNVQPSLTIKSLIKTINSVYSEKLSMCRDNQNYKKYEASMIMYDFLINMYGLKTVAESKFKQAIVSTCFYRNKNARVRNFSKFLGIDSDYVAEDWNFFLGAFESIDYNSLASGILGEISHYSPLQRLIQCVHSLFDEKINEAMIEEIVIMVYGLKVDDMENQVKRKGPKIVDAVNSDEFLDLMMKYYYKIKDKVYEKLKVEYARDELLEEKEYMELMKNSGISEDETLSRIFEIHSIVKKDEEERIFRVIRMESILNVIIDYSLLDTKTF
ncbi:hypothetical protein SteCoe_24211 [Stentor coeruleus]|uniref:Uncharacterized protein n=1 Tax=Stentor coeruleus TaxID=5963 RepID=A0A1R2BI21_9CILI|nr:hypothetical protein SteCoe_24211 [Stentor coeruleus]